MVILTPPNYQRMELILQRFRAIGVLMSCIDDDMILDYGVLFGIGALVQETAEQAMDLMDASLPKENPP